MTDEDKLMEYIAETASERLESLKKDFNRRVEEELREFERRMDSLRQAAEMDISTNDMVDMILDGGAFEVAEWETGYDGECWVRLEVDSRSYINSKVRLKNRRYRAILIIKPVGEVETEKKVHTGL